MTTLPVLTLDARVRVCGDVLVEPAGDDSVLLDLTSESYFGLNSVGTRIWSLLEGAPSLRAVQTALEAEYDVSAERLEADILALVGQLADAGLVAVE